MLDALVKLIDRVIQLKDFRVLRQRRIFEELYEPTYAEMVTIHKDYSMMSARIIEILRTVDTLAKGQRETEVLAALEEALTYVRSARIEQDAIRVKLRELNTRFRSTNQGGKERRFWAELDLYFNVPQLWNKVASSFSYSLQLLLEGDLHKFQESQGEEKLRAVKLFVDQADRDLKLQWTQLSAAYADLKANAVFD